MRSVFRLLAANLRHRKGAFAGIVLLMTIVTLSYAITVSNNRNLEQTVDAGLSARQYGDWVFQFEDAPAPELLDTLRSHDEITALHTDKVLNIACPVRADGTEDSELVSLRCFRQSDPVYNDTVSGFQDNVTLHAGEILLSYKLSTLEQYGIGKTVQLETRDGWNESYMVKGYYQEIADPTEGIGLLCDADFDRLFQKKRDSLFSLERYLYGFTQLHVCVQNGTDLKALEKQLKSECSIFDDAVNILTKAETKYYVMISASTGTRIVAVYTALLIIIVMIVMCNSIGTTVETEYTNLGILKALGFQKRQLRAVWVLQYALALLIGSVLGVALAAPLTALLGRLFMRLSNILTGNRLALGRCSLAALAILLICVIFVILATGRIGRISPVRAISGGHSEIYFDSRLHVRIRKRGRNLLLALRQFTSRSRSYFGSMLIVALLVFFLCTVMIFTKGINSDLFMMPTGDIELNMLSGDFRLEQEEEIRQICSRTDPAPEVLLWTGRYMTAEDTKILVDIYNQDSLFFKPLEGRLPKYENEIMVTELFAQNHEKHIGDTVTVKNGKDAAEFVITGLTQSIISPSGLIEMNFAGGKRIGFQSADSGYIKLSQPEQKAKIVKALNDEMSDVLSAAECEPGAYLAEIIDLVDLIMDIIICAVYSISLIFAAIVVTMICRRTFVRERSDLGIFRALGFTVPSLRVQFALRFLLIAVCGAAAGCIASVCCSCKLLSVLMRIIGITRFGNPPTIGMLLIPAAAVSAAFFIFAYLTSRKIRTVSVRELVTE